MIKATKHHLKILFSTLAATFKLRLENTCEHVLFISHLIPNSHDVLDK